MTRTSHRAHPTTSFPVYCLDWADDQTLLMGGGGGASRSGIENKLKACKVSKDGRNVKYTTELRLSSEEDAPMTMAVDRKSGQLVTGINSAEASVKAGSNEHCRVYSYQDEFALVRGRKTIEAEWSDDYPYQKITCLSPSFEFVAVGTTTNSGTEGQVAILRFPELEPVHVLRPDGELVDVDWGGADGDWLAITTTSALLLYRVKEGEKSDRKFELKQTISPPSLDANPVIYRSARFSQDSILHAILNVSKVKNRGAPKKSFVVNYGLAPLPEDGKGKEKATDLDQWDIITRREVASKQITVFDVSGNGKLLAYGCADLSVGILDAKTLSPLLKILHAHSFPPTALRFNPSATLLVSASADHTIRAIVVPASFDGLSMTVILLVALLTLILALLLRR
ncbi:WD40-repeat-containing domain protein [Kockovaella imperatae]|uniref:WD40-repeat-containing domain protein n=1 Tax=Kockovaella imperatae TaxID=4999 RepID=A0A1Y1UAV9_9TREE|nr:WD40-repeat-containing domain protein [Kockovaella imperatae]ORX34646.1 WD40-repeat-containing domain protein [Kockovaella imperatae]